MKNRLLPLLLTLSLLIAAPAGAAPKTLKGNGKLVSKELPCPQSFTAVSASRAVKVLLVDEPAGKIGIEADENVIDHVSVGVKGSTLQLTIDQKYTSISDIHVTITVPTDGLLTELEASSAAKIIAKTLIRGKSVELDASSTASIEASVEAGQCELEASSSGKIKADIKAETCDMEATSAARITAAVAVQQCAIDLSSAGKIELTGAALNCSAEASSAAKLDASGFAAKRCTIDTSSGSKVEICCLEKLSAIASSGSSILYRGDCAINRASTSSGGRIRKL